jgi:AAA+ superfamily predicted ATPase
MLIDVIIGIKYIDSIESPSTVVPLLKSLEFHRLGELEEAQKLLDQYINNISISVEKIAHPVILLALARILQKPNCIETFKSLYLNGDKWLLKSDKEPGNEIYNFTNYIETFKLRKNITAREEWEKLKREYNYKSQAMEDLLNLTGIERVKMESIRLFKCAIAFNKMDEESRKLNFPSLNKVFFGNPGTGKTTVARLFAKILHESGMRTTDVFIECTPMMLKEGGVGKFRDLVQKAEHGVLFIDEAYQLEPATDPQGRSIVSELLLVAENMRDTVTVILAGYEDCIEKNLYAFNTGLKSRFSEIIFDDFDERDLIEIFDQMVVAKRWTADNRISRMVAKKLSLSANKKGFGNARALRKIFEESAQKAISRIDFDGVLHLRVEDVVGENPLTNSKVKSCIDEFESKIGWRSVKKAVKELVSQAEQNYKRSLDGLDPLSICMNRLFLGNPGTG